MAENVGSEGEDQRRRFLKVISLQAHYPDSQLGDP